MMAHPRGLLYDTTLRHRPLLLSPHALLTPTRAQCRWTHPYQDARTCPQRPQCTTRKHLPRSDDHPREEQGGAYSPPPAHLPCAPVSSSITHTDVPHPQEPRRPSETARSPPSPSPSRAPSGTRPLPRTASPPPPHSRRPPLWLASSPSSPSTLRSPRSRGVPARCCVHRRRGRACASRARAARASSSSRRQSRGETTGT